MTSIFIGSVVIAILCGVHLLHLLHRSLNPKLFLAVRSSTTLVRSNQMQIQANINTTQVFDVVALGTQGENMNVPVDFALSNPAVADAVFDQAAMTLTLTFKALGTSDLVETATGTSISHTHQVSVVDVVASVDLRAHVDTAPVQAEPAAPAA